MTAKRMRDVIDCARDFHEALSAMYQLLSDRSGSERARLLLDYLQRHEHRLGEVLEEYEAGAPRALMETWFKPGPECPKVPALEAADLDGDISIDEIVCLALKLDDLLVQLYREAAEEAVSPEVRDAFDSLSEHTVAEEHQLVRDAPAAKDL